METLMAFVIGGLYAAGVYMILARDLIKIVISLGFLSHATNLLLLTVGGLTRARPPLVPEGLSHPLEPIANPLPQALILTAIVISFGLQTFVLVLAHRIIHLAATDDVENLTATDT